MRKINFVKNPREVFPPFGHGFQNGCIYQTCMPNLIMVQHIAGLTGHHMQVCYFHITKENINTSLGNLFD